MSEWIPLKAPLAAAPEAGAWPERKRPPDKGRSMEAILGLTYGAVGELELTDAGADLRTPDFFIRLVRISLGSFQ